MFKILFRRMAPLVAGVLLLAQTIAAFATYPYINSISRSGDTVTVNVAVAPYIPSGHTDARALPNNGYWWIDQNHFADGYWSVTPTGTWLPFTNACVYVYAADGSNYSYAIHDTVAGTSIYNGP